MAKRYWIIGFFLSIFFFGQILEVQAQKKIRYFWQGFGKNAEEYDDTRTFNVTIQPLNYTASNYFISRVVDWDQIPVDLQGLSIDNFASISPMSGHELGFGLHFSWRINHYLYLSTGINTMVERGRYDNTNTNVLDGPRITYNYQINSNNSSIRMHKGDEKDGSNFSTLEIPFHAKLRSDYKYFNNSSNSNLSLYRLYLIGGGKLSRHLYVNKYYQNMKNFDKIDPPLVVKPLYYNMEFGLGLDLYFKYFKLSPEFRFSQSLGNLLDHTRSRKLDNDRKITDINGNIITGVPNPYMNALDRLGIRSFQFSIILE